MAGISGRTNWEVRETGSDTNGGGWVPGSSGTDWSQQDVAQYAVTDGVTNGTTTITSATANFGADVVGNIIYVAGGTGAVAADWYQITARVNATTITVNDATGLTAGTGVTLNIGGAQKYDQICSILSAHGASPMVVWLHGSHSLSASPAGFADDVTFVGYGTTRGDRGYATLTAGAASVDLLNSNANNPNLQVWNVIFDGASQSSCNGIHLQNTTSAGTASLFNCKFLNFAGLPLKRATQSQVKISRCYFSGNVGITDGNLTDGSLIDDNTFVGNSGTICSVGHSAAFTGNIVGRHSGSSAVIVIVTSAIACVRNNTFHGVSGFSGAFVSFANNARDDLNGEWVNNNYFEGTSGTAISSGGTSKFGLQIDNNSFFNCGTNIASILTSKMIDGDQGTVTLSASGLTDPSTDNYQPNSTAGAGALLRAAGVGPATLTNYRDIGALQHQDSGGGGGTTIIVVEDD